MYTVCHTWEAKDKNGFISTAAGYVVVNAKTYVRVGNLVYKYRGAAIQVAVTLNQEAK